MESGGNLLLSDAVSLDTINVLYASIQGRQQLRGIDPSKGLLSDLEQCPDQRGGGVYRSQGLHRRLRTSATPAA